MGIWLVVEGVGLIVVILDGGGGLLGCVEWVNSEFVGFG